MSFPINAATSLGAGSPMGVQQIIAMRKEIIQRSDVLQQIHAARQEPAPGTIPQIGGAAAPSSFADTLKTAIDGVSAVQENASAVTAAYEKGEVTDVAQVMLARQEATVAFEATLQVRNKLLSAYQDIMRMGV